jgi:hypothetical protein
MRQAIVAIALVILSIFSACGRSGDSKSTSSASYEVNGKKPDDYFRQFIYRETGECGTIHELHHYPKWDSSKIGVNAAGNDVLANLSLLLKDDGTYSAQYQEIFVRRYFSSGYTWDSHQEKIVIGRWSMEGANLVLSSLGTASALEYNGQDAIQLRMGVDLISPGMRDQVIVLRQGAGEYSPIPALDPCQKK